MLAVLNNILDRCFFTLTFIAGIQLPEFIQQYKQRLAGHYDEAQLQLEQFQTIAQQHFDGSITTMIKRYKDNSEASIVDTGQAIEALTARLQYLQQHIEQLSTSNYVHGIYQFLRNLDQQIAINTAQKFTLAIPLELNALVTGAVLAITALLLKELSHSLIRYFFATKRDTLI